MKHKEAGYLLIELSVMIIIVGILMAGAIEFSYFYQKREDELETHRRMDVVTKALSTYTQTQWRLPCPASPSVSAGEAFGEERADCTTNPAVSAQGILPYRTLGLPEYYANDGWGNYFTYIVTPNFTRLNRISANDADNIVNRRLAYLLSDETIGLLPKLQFCGGVDVISDSLLVDFEGGALLNDDSGGQDVFDTQDEYSEYAFVQLSMLGTAPDPNYNRQTNVTTLAFALISHGPNGAGAYADNNTGNKKDSFMNVFGDRERQTSDNNLEVGISRQRRESLDNNYYDDVVSVMTQDRIYAAAGGGSCEYP